MTEAGRHRDPGRALRVEVLGPLRMVVDGRPVEVPGPKRRALLALLAMAEGRAVSVDRLVDSLWPTDVPDGARGSLHSHVSRLRGHLGPAADRLQAGSGTYRLVLDEAGLDSAQARSLLARATRVAREDPVTAGALAREAADLWRGPVLADLRDVEPLAAWAVALDELHREVVDLVVATALEVGDAGSAVGTAAEAVAADPGREPSILLLMRALAATGRPSDALRAGYEYRRRLREETGLEPSSALSDLEHEIAAGPAPASDERSPQRPRRHRPLGRLFGRDSELAAVQRLLATERLVTIVGPGGVGKTRLALEVAGRMGPADVLLLAPVTDDGGIPHALAAALELHSLKGDALSACIALLEAGPRLLVVDNCEHLLDGVRDVVAQLLDTCPELCVLATSRERLGLVVETACRLAPLPLPEPDDPADAGATPAVAMFLDRARRAQPDVALGPAELRVVVDIVRRLDAMPLAIELAAGRLSSLGLRDLHERLDRALDLLGDGRPSADARHRTLRATIEWSYDLLPDHERRLFRQLAMFPDGIDLSTAEWVATDLGSGGEPARALAHLVDASMVSADLGGRPRYRMLETLRAFGLDRLDAAEEAEEATGRFLRWAVGTAEWIGSVSVTDAEADADLVLRREMGNLRAAWGLARRTGRFDEAARIVCALSDPAAVRELTELAGWALELLDDLTDGGGGAQHPLTAKVLAFASGDAWMRGDLRAADDLARRGLAVAGSDEARGAALSALAVADLHRGAFADAVVHAVEAATVAPVPDSSYAVAAMAATYSGDLDGAARLNERMGAVAASPTLRAFHAYAAGEIDSAAGRHQEADGDYRRALDLARSSGATFVEGVASVGLLTLLVDAGRVDEALRGYRDLIDYWEHAGRWIQQWTTLRNLASLLRRLDDDDTALFLDVAADRAPDAPAVGETIWSTVAPAGDEAVDPEPEAEIRKQAASATRPQVLDVARRAIDRHLAAGPVPVRSGRM